MDDYQIYPIFTSLQRPYEFMGLKGRYIFWVAGGVLGAIVAFFLLYTTIGVMYAAITFIVITGTSIGFTFIRQKKGLHTKKEFSGICIYKKMYEIQLENDYKKK